MNSKQLHAAFVFLLAVADKTKYIFVKMSPKIKEVCIEMRELIIKLRKEGNSLNSIARTVNRAKSTVQTILKNFSESKSVASKARSGRVPRGSSRLQRYIRSVVVKNPKVTAVEIRNILESDDNVNVRVPRKKPFISH
ncbi:Helix-turn-helix domain [Popillia japonica]|uniref:Helix-turn-helix domain n=1 Tax=Popillia japonica TaxID=7064 RepID=A0AAW1JVQ0_POPJA